MSARFFMLMWLVFACSACIKPSTQLLLSVDWAVPNVDHVKVVTYDSTLDSGIEATSYVFTLETSDAEVLNKVTKPFSFAVIPQYGLETHPAKIRVLLYDAAGIEPIATREVLLSFTHVKKISAKIMLPAACANQLCPEGTTCGDSGACVTIAESSRQALAD